MNELIEKFSLENVGKSSGVFNPEKLLWLNAHYIKEAKPESIAGLVQPFLEIRGCKDIDDGKLVMAVKTLQERSKTLLEMAEGGEFYFKDEITYDENAVKKFFTTDKNIQGQAPDIKEPMQKLVTKLKTLEPFSHDNIQKAFQEILDETGLKLGKLAQPVRVALTGKTVSPGIFEVMEVLGRGKVISRIEKSKEFV